MAIAICDAKALQIFDISYNAITAKGHKVQIPEL